MPTMRPGGSSREVSAGQNQGSEMSIDGSTKPEIIKTCKNKANEVGDCLGLFACIGLSIGFYGVLLIWGC